MSIESAAVRQVAMRWRRFRYALLGMFITVSLILGLMSYMGVFNGNVRVVDPGRIYRSAQLVDPQLAEVLKTNHIRSVINLRGHLTDDIRIRNEWATCRKMKVAHVDISMSATHLPRPTEARKLLVAFDTLPRPILVHCAGGSDRTGLACSLYMHVYKGMPLGTALHRQLTWRYGHLAFTSSHPMDDFFALYRKTGQGMSLRQWISERYPRVYAEEVKHTENVSR
ncbi:MAG: tyrosine-protein phosphatase [Armatimonadota bacterium]